jgi:hypothetical protein
VNSGNVSNSCSSIDTRHLIVVANSVINNEWGKDRITIKTTMCVVFMIIYTRVLIKKDLQYCSMCRTWTWYLVYCSLLICKTDHEYHVRHKINHI